MEKIVEWFQKVPLAFLDSTLGAKIPGFAEKLAIAVAVVAGQVLIIWLIWFLAQKISARIKANHEHRFKALTIRNFRILTAKQIVNAILFSIRILKYLITIFQLFITIPIVFSLFPATEDLASTIFSYVLNPLKNILLEMV